MQSLCCGRSHSPIAKDLTRTCHPEAEESFIIGKGFFFRLSMRLRSDLVSDVLHFHARTTV